MQFKFVKNAKLILCLLFFYFFFLPSFAIAQETILRITLTSPLTQETGPGRIISASFLTANNISSSAEYSEELLLPDGWQAITPPPQSYFSLRPKEQQLRLVSFLVPREQPAGEYRISYVVRSRRDERVSVKQDFSVVVSSVTNIGILVEEKPEIVISGDLYKVRARLTNQGNSEMKLKIDVSSVPELPVKVGTKELILAPRSSQPLLIQVKTDKNMSRSTDSVLMIRAVTEDAKYKTEEIVPVKIVSRVTGRLDPYFRLPARIKLIGLSDKVKGGKHTDRFQNEISGSGPLDEEGKRNVDFLFRNPDLQNIGPFGQQAEYYLNYNDKLLDFHAGDRNFSLSPLSEEYRYTRGYELDLHPGERFAIGAYNTKDEWNEPVERRHGSFMSYKFSDAFSLKGNFLDKINDPSGYDDKIYSLQAFIRPGKAGNFDLEYAQNKSDRNGAAFNDKAYRFYAYGAHEEFKWRLENIHAGPEFFGYYNDMDSKTCALDFPVYKKLKGNFYYHQYTTNLDQDPAKDTSDREDYFKNGLLLPLDSGLTFSLDYEDYRKNDRIVPQNYNFSERVATFGLGWTKLLKIFNFQGYLERGPSKNDLLDSEKTIQRSRLYLSFDPAQSLSFNLYAVIGNDRFSDNPQKTKNAGIGIVWRVLDALNISLNYERVNFDSGDQQEQNKIMSRMTYFLPNRHYLEFKSYWAKNKVSKSSESSYFLSYTIPWDMPVARKKNIGVLKGRVFDVEKSGKPLANVILITKDATAVTNGSGEFVFPVLLPGTHSVWIEKGSVGLDRVTVKKSPLTVEIKEGRTARLDIGIVASSRISGQLTAFDYKEKPTPDELAGRAKLSAAGKDKDSGEPPKNELAEKGGLYGVLVEINDGEEMLQQRTDASGRFSFDNIRPGHWTLLFNGDDLPEQYSTEQEEFEVDIKPGEEKEVKVKALPRIRNIQIIEKEELKLEKRPGRNIFLEGLRKFWKRPRSR